MTTFILTTVKCVALDSHPKQVWLFMLLFLGSEIWQHSVSASGEKKHKCSGIRFKSRAERSIYLAKKSTQNVEKACIVDNVYIDSGLNIQTVSSEGECTTMLIEERHLPVATDALFFENFAQSYEVQSTAN
jgi:hypothetical protein